MTISATSSMAVFHRFSPLLIYHPVEGGSFSGFFCFKKTCFLHPFGGEPDWTAINHVQHRFDAGASFKSSIICPLPLVVNTTLVGEV